MRIKLPRGNWYPLVVEEALNVTCHKMERLKSSGKIEAEVFPPDLGSVDELGDMRVDSFVID